ncbi:MAG: Secretion system C-terminal sorting domain [Bacteroidota bacterium]|jgi:hypothetical protein
MKPIVTLITLILFQLSAMAQLPPQLWSIAHDTLNDNVFHYHKNLAISGTGLSAALSSRNDIDQLEVYEADGSLRYSKGFADDQCWYYQVEFSADDELYLIGTNQPQSQEGTSMRVQKLDNYGNVLWTTNWAENATEYTGVIRSHLLSDGRLVVCGQFNFYTAGSSNDFYVVCLNIDGSMDWTYVYTSNGIIIDILRNSFVDASDNIYFTGIRQNPNLTSYYNLIAGKLDNEGNLLWTADLDYTNFNGQSVDAEAVIVDANGMVLLAANTFTYNDQNIPISIPVIARLYGSDGTTAGVQLIEFDRSATIRDLIADDDGNYYGNFITSRDSIYFITPEFFDLVTYEVSHHVKKWNSDDEVLWSFDEIASPLAPNETYNMIIHDDQLFVFHYFENNNRILCLSPSGSSLDTYTYPRPVTHIGVYQHHIKANNHGVYLLCGSTQPSAQFRPYYVLTRFSLDPDFIVSPDALSLTIYPNPANNFTMIRDLPQDAIVSIYDASGRLVPIQRNGSMIEWSSVASGIYIVEVTTGPLQQRQRLLID